MDTDLESQRHLREVFQRIYDVEEGIRATKAVGGPAGLRDFLSTIERICNLLKSSLLEEVTADSEPEEIEEIASRFDLAVFDLHRDAFDFTTTELIQFYPNEILPALASQISQFQPKAALILHPYSGNSYETHVYESLFEWYRDTVAPGGPDEDNASSARSMPSDTAEWFVFFSYPKGEAQNLLLHLIMLSHEVMHLRDIRRKLVDAILSDVEVSIESEAVQTAVQQIAASPIDRSEALLIPRSVGELYTNEHLQSVVVAESNAVIGSWLREIVSDMLAARVYGPAYLVAFATLSRALGVLNKFSNTHPSSYFRMRFILKELEDLGYDRLTSSFQRFRDALVYWTSRLSDEDDPAVPYHTIAASKISGSADAIRKVVRKESRQDDLKLQDFVSGVSPLLEYLREGIPPAQVLTPDGEFEKARFNRILNVGWYFYLSEIETLADILGCSHDPSEPKPLEKLNQLVAKAFEASQLLDE